MKSVIIGRVYDGSNGSVDRRLHLPQASAAYHRTAHRSEGISMSYVHPVHGDVTIARGVHEADEALHALIAHGFRTIAIRDDFPFWRYTGHEV